MKSVLVTGGAGFLGINLVRALLERGYRVSSLDLADFDYPERAQIREIRGDIRDPEIVGEAMRGHDYLVHAAAALPRCSAEEIYATDVTGTRVVMSAARRYGVERAVHVSTTAVYGLPDRCPLREEDPLDGVGPYGKAKIQAEMACLEERGRGLCVSILRPKSFVGPERLGVFGLLFDWALDGRSFPVLDAGESRYQLLDVADLCDAIHACFTVDRAIANDTFNVGARAFGTLAEAFQAVLDAAGHGKRVVPFPAAPAIMALRALDALGVSPIYAWVYETAAKESFVSIEKAARLLGFSPRYSNEEALLRSFAWYRDHRPRPGDGPGVTHRTPWKQGAIGLLKGLF